MQRHWYFLSLDAWKGNWDFYDEHLPKIITSVEKQMKAALLRGVTAEYLPPTPKNAEGIGDAEVPWRICSNYSVSVKGKMKITGHSFLIKAKITIL